MSFPVTRRMRVSIIVAVQVLALVACSSTGQTSSGTASSGGAQGKKVVYIWPSKEPVYTAVGCGAQDAAKAAGVDFSFSEPPRTFSPSDQIPIVNAVIAQRPDAIMVSASDPKALVVPLKQAAAQGIKVVTVSNNIDDNDPLTAAVIGDNKASGANAADMLAKLLNGKSGEVAYIAYQRGGSTITDDRQDGFEAEITKYPNLRYIGPTLSGVDQGDGAVATNAILAGHPDLIGIVGSFVPASNDMASTLRERQLAGKVVALALDADPAGIANIHNNSLAGLQAEPFRQEGHEAMQQLINAFEGKPVTERIDLPPVEFSKANVDDPAMAQYVPGDDC